MQAYADRGHRYAARMSGCSQYLLYALQTVPDADKLVLKLKNSWFCRVRHCPVCQWRREQKWRGQFFRALPRILEENPTSRFLFLTLTVKNCDPLDLRETLTHMNKSWDRFVKYKQFPAYGWLRSAEVTKGKDGLAHPHFHALLMVGSSYFKYDYLKHEDWRSLWQKAARLDYEPMVNIKVVKPKLSAVGDDQGMFAAICETIKYSVKPADIIDDPDWLLMLTHELHKTRAVATGGILKEYLKELGQESEDDDLINVGDGGDDEEVDEEVAKLLFNWKSDVKRYVTKGVNL
jgi:plasmid rolling circle replication initiator protein Rep